MGYSMKGSPAKRGAIQGTAGHRSAVKQMNLDWLKNVSTSGGDEAISIGDVMHGSKASEQFGEDKDVVKKEEFVSPRQEKLLGKKEKLEKEHLRMGEKGSVKGWSEKKLTRKEGKNIQKQRRMEEKIHRQKVKDAMTPEERAAARDKKRVETGRALYNIGQTIADKPSSYGPDAGALTESRKLNDELKKAKIDLAKKDIDDLKTDATKKYGDQILYDVGAGEGQKGMTDEEGYAKFLKTSNMSGDTDTFEQWKKRRA